MRGYIEVVGIPALRCQVCGEQSYDLTLLAHIESALRRRVERGDVRTSYLFEQLAAELITDSLFSEKGMSPDCLFFSHPGRAVRKHEDIEAKIRAKSPATITPPLQQDDEKHILLCRFFSLRLWGKRRG